MGKVNNFHRYSRLLHGHGGARWLRDMARKLAQRGRLPGLPSVPYKLLPPGLPLLADPVLGSFAGVMPRSLGLGRGFRSANNPRPSAIWCGPNYGGDFPVVPKSRTLPARRAARAPPAETIFAQVGPGHKQCTVRRGWIIPWRTSSYSQYWLFCKYFHEISHVQK
jgi:hypothetical protein